MTKVIVQHRIVDKLIGDPRSHCAQAGPAPVVEATQIDGAATQMDAHHRLGAAQSQSRRLNTMYSTPVNTTMSAVLEMNPADEEKPG